MEKQSVQVCYDVYCDWAGEPPPRYRLYVNDELFVERTFKFVQSYLEETIPIDAPPGMYVIKYLMIDPNGQIVAKNPRVLTGPAEFVAENILRINQSENA